MIANLNTTRVNRKGFWEKPNIGVRRLLGPGKVLFDGRKGIATVQVLISFQSWCKNMYYSLRVMKISIVFRNKDETKPLWLEKMKEKISNYVTRQKRKNPVCSYGCSWMGSFHRWVRMSRWSNNNFSWRADRQLIVLWKECLHSRISQIIQATREKKTQLVRRAYMISPNKPGYDML